MRCFIWRSLRFPSRRKGFGSVWRVGAMLGSLVCCVISSVVGGNEVRSPFGNLCRAQSSRALLCCPSIAFWLSHEGLTKFERGSGLSHELAPTGAVLRQGGAIR